MGLKYRSLVDFAQIIGGNREGMNLGIDGAVYLRREPTERTFEPPRIGTQGKSEGAVSASTDISGGTDDSIDISVQGGTVVTATIASLVGLSTGLLIAAALETAINNALAAGANEVSDEDDKSTTGEREAAYG